MTEVPWPNDPLPCVIVWPEATAPQGGMHFLGPKDDYGYIPVTRGPTTGDPGPVWHVDDDGGDTVVTQPSVHFKGHWHSPYTTTWRVVGRENFETHTDLLEHLKAGQDG